ncbi:alpha/beta-hydrolase [Irpex rosettiformis]|uniref:Alpha/beta-hydrolase n=1 Tax=Irpex rosettiformis TaxID=378272 RepID=A0ACB8U009_9APHY|nr:alpha/beta-hydrolase [Irpex rosettiformis]
MLDIQEFILRGPLSDGGLALCFKRCRPSTPLPQPRDNDPKNQVVLFLAHCVGQHKESWFPTLEHLFSIQASSPLPSNASTTRSIGEAWVMDSQNHGYSGILNERAWMGRPEGVAATEWARGAQVLLRSGLIQGTSVIGIGHSAGAGMIVLAAHHYPLNASPSFSSIIIIDPGIFSPATISSIKSTNGPLIQITNYTKTKKDTWDSREAARAWMVKRLPWSRWNPKVLDLFIEHGLRDLPSATYPAKTRGVTLSTPIAQETAGYTHYESAHESLSSLASVCEVMPVHCIWAGLDGIVNEDMRREIMDESQGRRMASSVTIRGAAHPIPQEKPAVLASAIWNAIQSQRNQLPVSRL